MWVKAGQKVSLIQFNGSEVGVDAGKRAGRLRRMSATC